MKEYIIGIDTGGTYTDAVLVKKSSGEVIEVTKTPTTHHQLSDGIATALEKILQASAISSDAIEAVAISSTLATNAVVENRGARVALFVIGYVKHFKLPVKAVLYLKGGHTITGEEEEPLDLEYLVSTVENLRDEVDAFAVCSAMSIKNPAHELVTEKAIGLLAPKPVFSSHRISNIAGMHERAATAGLHAKLMPLMKSFIEGVDEAMKYHDISCPMIIIGGDARSLGSEEAAQHGGKTVASGPACTTYFGASETTSDALVIDIGGTTTDLTMIRDGIPLISGEGCQIGEWRTHVEAVNMVTRGIGGDSHVVLDEKNNLEIGPRRVNPIALSPTNADLSNWLGSGGKSKCIEVRENHGQMESSDQLLQVLQQFGPCTPADLKKQTGLSAIPLEKQLEHLSRSQLIVETGFTPTDALHVLGEMDLGSSEKARDGANRLGRCLNMSGEDFATLVFEKTVERIEEIVLEFITTNYWNTSLTAFLATRNSHPILGVDFTVKIPLIGIGAAARFFLPKVAERLKTTVHFPNNYQVGNAIGAALIYTRESKK